MCLEVFFYNQKKGIFFFSDNFIKKGYQLTPSKGVWTMSGKGAVVLEQSVMIFRLTDGLRGQLFFTFSILGK